MTDLGTTVLDWLYAAVFIFGLPAVALNLWIAAETDDDHQERIHLALAAGATVVVIASALTLTHVQ